MTFTFLDLGEAIVLVLRRTELLRQALLDRVTDDDWAQARAGFGDEDLATE